MTKGIEVMSRCYSPLINTQNVLQMVLIKF